MTRQEELFRDFMKSDREPTSEEFDKAFDKTVRLKEIEKDIATIETLPVSDTVVLLHKEALKKEAAEIATWLAGKSVDAPPTVQNELLTNAAEKKTVAKLIFTMAVDGYGYDPKQKKSPIPTEIMKAAAKADIPISEDTVRKWLKEGASHQK
jgi:hypothetical protein